MYSIKNNILYFIVLIVLVQVQSLVELREEDKDLSKIEAVVRKTVNSIFSILNLEYAKHKARFGEFAAIHNFFVTITFRDDENLKEIARLARADNIDNNTQHFITQLNEVLNEDNKTYEATEDEYITAHIETFIRKLEYLKFKYGFAKNAANFGINTQVLNHLISDDNLQNSTKAAQEVNDMDGNLLSQNEFWNPSASRRIFDGRRATIKRFPFMASVQFFKKFQCGGSIIKSDLVITSASCLQLAWNNRFFRENPAFLSVQVGCDLYEGGDENIAILEVYFHPEYNPRNLRNNLAIMRLVRALKFGKHISKIKKIDFDRDPWPLATNTPGITIIGWGAKASSNMISNVWSARLAYAVLDFYPLRECQEVYSREFVSNKNFCAGFFSKGGGACNRDAGGPGVAYGKLIGVVSFGSPICGAPDAPTVFTKLGFYTEWIEGIMEMKVPTVRKVTTLRTTREPIDINSLVISTKGRFTVTPITTGPHTIIPPTPTTDALRSLDESKLFKEFITTMFGSEEVKEYLDQFESDTDTEEKATTRHISSATIFKPTTGPTTEADVEEHTRISADYDIPQDQKGSVRMVTTIDHFDEFKEKSEEEVKTPTVEVSTSDQKMDEEEQEEQNIAKLINDIDIQDLLSFETSEIFSEDEQVIKPKEPKHKKDKIQPKKHKTQRGKEKIEMTYESVSESREEITNDDNSDDNGDDDEYEHHSADQPQQSEFDKNYSTHTKKKVKNDKKKNNSFRDVTFRLNTTARILNTLSQKELLKLLNEAVAEVAQSAKSKQYSREALDHRHTRMFMQDS